MGFSTATRGGRKIVRFISPPGPEAVHQTAFFSFNPQYVEKLQAIMWNNFGLQFDNITHSHHTLDLREPSYVDIKNSRNIIAKNRLQHFYQIIVTYSQSKTSYTYTSPHTDQNAKPQIRVRLSAYKITADPAIPPQKIKIKVLPNTVSFRRAIADSGLVEGVNREPDFPMEWIDLDPVDKVPATSEIPPELIAECDPLPREIKNQILCSLKEDYVILLFPAVIYGQIGFVYDRQSPPILRDLYWLDGQSEPQSIRECYGKNPKPSTLAALYYRALEKIAGIYHRQNRRTGPRKSQRTKTGASVVSSDSLPERKNDHELVYTPSHPLSPR